MKVERSDLPYVFVALMAVLFGIAMAVSLDFQARAESGPEILVVRQEYVPDVLRGGDLLLVEYYVGGASMAATFREGEDGLYREWMAHLEASGRVRVLP